MNEFGLLTLVVIFFSTIQSLFGVGLLVFGTPTLLLLGHSFESTIGILLPASIIISFMQVIHGRTYIKLFRKSFFLYSVPFIILGLSMVLTEFMVFDVKFLVGIMLLLTGIIRQTETIQQSLTRFLKRHMKLYLMIMGMVHGLSNMGGGLLTILATAIYDDKESTRANIAYGYLIFAISQLLILFILTPEAITINSLIFPIVAFITYWTVGNAIYLKSSKTIYQAMITFFILVYGIILMSQTIVRIFFSVG